jgi:hypothetical protein
MSSKNRMQVKINCRGEGARIGDIKDQGQTNNKLQGKEKEGGRARVDDKQILRKGEDQE